MSENQNRKVDAMSKYDAMSTEELEEILRLDAEAPLGQESDTDTILYIMEVLTERKQNNSHTQKTALEAYESFQQNYMPETDNTTIPMKPKRRYPRWARGLTAAAAVLVLLLIGTVTAKAFGCDIWKAVVQWTQETFHFGQWGDSKKKDDLPYGSLQEALEDDDITASLAPNWVPMEYKLVDIYVERNPIKTIYKAIYLSGDQSLVVTIQDHLGTIPVYVEQNDKLVDEYTVAEITYYLFKDIDMLKAKWINGSYECSITGNVTIDELKKMVDSIEKG